MKKLFCLVKKENGKMKNVIYITHVSWAQAYKAQVGGVSPQCGIEQNREGHEQIKP